MMSINTHTPTHTHDISTLKHIYAHTHTYMYTNLPTYSYTHIHTHIHTPKHMHTTTPTHTDICVGQKSASSLYPEGLLFSPLLYFTQYVFYLHVPSSYTMVTMLNTHKHYDSQRSLWFVVYKEMNIKAPMALGLLWRAHRCRLKMC